MRGDTRSPTKIARQDFGRSGVSCALQEKDHVDHPARILRDPW